ncbi:ATP-binding protein [Aquabacterium humicola]|uniref:ATP-binding protein n=1 Tax=Aquabacterium humicola TaxID=3237377 RepID=UPI002542A5EE|nr:ATP-binding protein [Rubrivivax pictus]
MTHRFGLQARLAALLGMLLVLLALGGVLTVRHFRGATSALQSVVDDRIAPLRQLRLVADGYAQGFGDTVARLREGRLDKAQALARLDAARRQVDEQWAAYLRTLLVDDEQRLIAAARPLLHAADRRWAELRTLIAADAGSAWRDDAQPLRQVLDPVADALARLMDVQWSVAQSLLAQERQHQRESTVRLAALGLVGLLACGALGWAVLSRHAHERRESEAREQRMLGFYQALSRTNQLIVRERDMQRLFDEIVRICVDTGHAWATCVFVLEDGHLQLASSAGESHRLHAGVPVRWDIEQPAVRGSVIGHAFTTQQPTVSNDYVADPRSALLREQAVALGLQAVAAFPLLRGGRAVGVLSVYATERDFFDEALTGLLTEMAHDLSFALDDIDRRAERVAALREAEAGLERFRRVFHASPIATVITSMRDYRIVDINDTCCQRYGLPRDAFIGHTLRALGIGLVSEDRDAFYTELRQTGRVRDRVVRVRDRDGTVRRELISAEPIDYLGEPCHVAMSLDVTSLHRAEQAQAVAEAANRAKTEFLSRMSHELRAPLNAVIGFARLLQDDAGAALDAPRRAQLGHIHRAGQHLLALIDDVLDVSRIEAGQLQLSLQPVALGPLIDEALQMSRPLADRHQVTLQATPAARDGTWVRADPIRLRQVLLNLLSNGAKYNRPGGKVTVGLAQADHHVAIEITDTGLGMQPEQLAQLFQPFNRLGREGSGIEGTGIGLTLTRQLVHMMNGTLQLDSTPDQGTCARIELPLARAPADPASAAAAPAVAPAAPGDGPPPRGLVVYVDDDPVNLLLVEQLLARWPEVRTVTAGGGERGLALARSLRPDLLLLDLHLPDLGGLEVMRRLRADPSMSTLPIVALSASAMPEDVAAAIAAGATDYWTKPLDFDRVLPRLRELLAPAAARPA